MTRYHYVDGAYAMPIPIANEPSAPVGGLGLPDSHHFTEGCRVSLTVFISFLASMHVK